jgi:hypothetical protein
MDDKIYLKILLEKYQDIVNSIIRNQYKIFIPPYKYISQDMLSKNFYENHIFYQSEYNPLLYISLNGRVIEQSQSEDFFQTYIGYKKYMKFNIISKSPRELQLPNMEYPPIVTVINIDNVIEENFYNPPASTMKESMIKKDVLIRYETKEEYISYYNSMLKSNSDFKEIDSQLNIAVKKLQNEYILLKNHVAMYSMYFQEHFVPVKELISQRLEKFKADDAYQYAILELGITPHTTREGIRVFPKPNHYFRA